MEMKGNKISMLGLLCVSLFSLAGCSTGFSNTAITTSQKNLSLNRVVVPQMKGTDGRQYAELATSIPKNMKYLKVEFVVQQNRKQVGVMIGHQLTTKGAGIQDHVPVFFPR